MYLVRFGRKVCSYAVPREEKLVDLGPCLVVSVHGAGGACTAVCSWLAGWTHHYGLTVHMKCLAQATCTS